MRKGFTLVELSIVLVIIGLLIGGILVGQSMIESARAYKYIKELNMFKFSFDAFKQQYKQMPGDFSRRVEIYGESVNGNGDGLVEWNNDEANYFWRDMRAHTLKDYSKTFVGTGHYAIRGKRNTTREKEFYYGFTYYSGGGGRYGDLYSVSQDDSVIGVNTTITLASQDIDPGVASVDKPFLTASQVMSIDIKMDDGLPRTGLIRGHRGTLTYSPAVYSVCSQLSGTTYQYKIDTDTPSCRMLYLIEKY